MSHHLLLLKIKVLQCISARSNFQFNTMSKVKEKVNTLVWWTRSFNSVANRFDLCFDLQLNTGFALVVRLINPQFCSEMLPDWSFSSYARFEHRSCSSGEKAARRNFQLFNLWLSSRSSYKKLMTFSDILSYRGNQNLWLQSHAEPTFRLRSHISLQR